MELFELLEELPVDAAVEGINPFAEVLMVPDKSWNWGVPAPGRVEPEMMLKFVKWFIIKENFKNSDKENFKTSFLSKIMCFSVPYIFLFHNNFGLYWKNS